MANPVLTDKAFERAAATAPGATTYNPQYDAGVGRSYAPTDTDSMTLRGTMSATAVLFTLLLAAAGVGWAMVTTVVQPDGTRMVESFPGWIIGAVLVGFAMVLVASFKPELARFLGPLYAVVEGLVVGAISHVYESQYEGIVLQALGATLAVFAVMLVAYATRAIRVTDRLRSIVVSATLGLMVFYGISLLMNLFGVDVPFIRSASPLGILFSVFAAGLAAFNLLLDFDFIERGVAARAPRFMEWFAGLGLMVTVVWLYLELLRLLSKLQRN
jgi:uncharacterized YccA/Bax inhibitor family protein